MVSFARSSHIYMKNMQEDTDRLTDRQTERQTDRQVEHV